MVPTSLALLACAPPPPPEAVVRTDDAAVLGDRAVFHRVVERQLDGRLQVTAERCLAHGDAITCGPSEGPAGLLRVGNHVLEDRRSIGAPEARELARLDLEAGTISWRAPVGFRPPSSVAGGEVLPHPDGGLVVLANHGLWGAETWTADTAPEAAVVRVVDVDAHAATPLVVVEASGSATVEAWPALEGDRPRWRRAVPAWPTSWWVAGRRVGVFAERWSVFDLDTGAVVTEVAGTRAACVAGDRLYTHADGTLHAVDLTTGEDTPSALPLPDEAQGCLLAGGRPVFHGLSQQGGWLAGPTFPALEVPAWDLDRAVSTVEEPTPWWILAPYRSLSFVDPDTRQIRTIDGVSRGWPAEGFWTVVDGANLRVTVATTSAERTLEHRTWPEPKVAADGVLWTFPSHAPESAPVVQRLRLPSLEPLD